MKRIIVITLLQGFFQDSKAGWCIGINLENPKICGKFLELGQILGGTPSGGGSMAVA